ncbi:unnamed protein product [Calypogeia fissa]
MERVFPEESFKSVGNYGRALAQTPQRFRKRVFARSSLSDEMGAIVKRSGDDMKRSLNWWDLSWMTIGCVVVAGVFVLTGQEAHSAAGPSIILSYAAAGFAAMLAVLNYAEFAVEIPVAGGSFAYLRVELGDFTAFIGAGNLVLGFIVGGAAVARAWTSFFASLINTQPNSIRFHVSTFPSNYSQLDPIAVAVLLHTMMVAVWSTKWTSIVNWIAGLVNMGIIAFVIIAGLAHAKTSNFTHSGDPNLKDGFVPFGAHGIFQAASVLFFAYLGFDATTTMAEETKNPKRDILLGLVGAMILVTIVYMLMALTLVLMVPYGLINDVAPFSYAFEYVGWNWAKYLVALGALKGITTVILLGNVGQARYVTHIARTHMISPWFAKVNHYTQTPINATVSTVLATCVVALFTDLYIWFDAVTTMAEETKNPGRDMPIGLVGAMVLTTIVYMLMALALTLMVPHGLINDEAPFSYAFEYVGWNWAKYLVALGALKGITTVILVANVGQARSTNTPRLPSTPPPVWSSLPVVALFTDLNVLGNLLSVSTLFIFSLLAMALLVRRYYDPVETTRQELLIFISASTVIVSASVAIAGYWAATNVDSKWVGYLNMVPIWFFGTLAIQLFCPQRRTPKIWGVPLVPWTPSLSIAVNIFLLGSIDKASFMRFSVWTGALLVYYFFVGLHASYDAATDLAVDMAKGVDSGSEQISSGIEHGLVYPVQKTPSPDRQGLRNEANSTL